MTTKDLTPPLGSIAVDNADGSQLIGYRLTLASGLAASDGGPGNITLGVGVSTAFTQETWWINKTTGSDAANGKTSGTALKTIAELRRRLGIGQVIGPPVPGPRVIQVNVPLGLADTDAVTLFTLSLGKATTLLFKGTPTTTRTGAFTAVTALNRATNTRISVTDGVAAGDFAPGERLRVTAGPNVGRKFWVTKNLGAKACDVTRPATTQPADSIVRAPTLGTVSLNDPYEVETVPGITLAGINADADNASADVCFVIFQDLEVRGADIAYISSSIPVCFTDCLITIPEIIVQGSLIETFFENSLIKGCLLESTGGGDVLCLAGGVVDGAIEVGVGGALILDGDFQGQNSTIVQTSGGSLSLGDACAFDSQGDGFVIGIDFSGITNAGCVAANVTPQQYGTARVYGSGNAGVGIHLGAGSKLAYVVPAANLTITGAGGDFALAAATTGRAWDEGGGTYTAPVPCTWTNLGTTIGGGGFGGSAHNVQSDAHVLVAA